MEAASAGLNVIKEIAKYTKENIIDIKHICLSTSLEKAKNACFNFDVSVVIGGKHKLEKKVDACIDVSFVKTIAKAIADKIFPGIDKIKEKLKSALENLKSVGGKKEELKKLEESTDARQKELEGEIQEEDEEEDEEDQSQSKVNRIC